MCSYNRHSVGGMAWRSRTLSCDNNWSSVPVTGTYRCVWLFCNCKIKSVFPVAAVGSALLGFWLMIMPDFFITTLMYVLGVLLVLAGLSQLFNFISVRSFTRVPFLMYVIPVLVLLAGIVVLANPFQAATLPFTILGISAIVYSLTDLIRLIRFKKKVMKEEENIVDITPIEEIKDK